MPGPQSDLGLLEAEGALEHPLGLGADGRSLRLTALEENHRRDAHDAVTLRKPLLLVDVDLDEPQLPLLGDLVEDGRDRMTRAAPLRPEVDEDRLGAFENFLLKRRFRDGVCHIF